MTKIRGESAGARMRLPAVLAGLALFLQSAPVWGLTLPEAVDLAVKTYPGVRAAEEFRQSLEQKLRKEFSGYLPKVNFVTGYGRETNDNPTTRAARIAEKQADGKSPHNLSLSRGEAGLTVSQMVFDGFDVRSKVAQAEAQLNAAQAGLRAVADDTALKAVQSYVDVVIKYTQLELIKDNVLLHQRILDKVRKKFEGGAGNQADVYQAESRTYLASAGHASNQAAYEAALAKFTEIVGQAPGEGMSRPENPESLLPKTLETAVDAVLKNNPGIESARYTLAAVEAEREAAKAAFSPKVDVELGATNNANMGGSEGHSNSASAMLRMRYNIYQGGADLAELRGVRNRVGQAQQSYDKTQRNVLEQIRETWSKLTTTRDRVDFLKKHVDVSKHVTASYHDQFKMGKRTLLDVLNSENELFSAQNALLFEELTYIKTSYEVLAMAGILPEAFSYKSVTPAGGQAPKEKVEKTSSLKNSLAPVAKGSEVVEQSDLSLRDKSKELWREFLNRFHEDDQAVPSTTAKARSQG